ncbi:MAG: hypothetical protein WCO25_02140 [Candidatus Uhrbacteria bacterium]
MRPFHQKLAAVIFLVASSFFASAHPSFAFGLSPPEVTVSRTLSSSSSVRETVGLQRGDGEVGALVFEVGFHGECGGCVTGENTIVMGPDQDAVEYKFVVSPGADIETGDYRQYIAFLLTDVSGSGDGSGNAVQRGVTATVRFSVRARGSGGGNPTGGGGGGITQEPTPSTPTTTPTTPSTNTTTTDGTGGSIAQTPADTGSSGSFGSDTGFTDTTGTPSVSQAPVVVPTVTPAGPTGSVSQEGAPASGAACDNAGFSLDRNGDGIQGSADVTTLMSEYLGATCALTCDLNADCAFTLLDIAAAAELVGAPKDAAPSVPPVTPGPALATEQETFYFEEGGALGKYEFVLAAAEKTPDDLVTFYLLADTGPSGVRAADVTFRYDTDVLDLVDVSTLGSIFPYVRGEYGKAGAGSIRLIGASDVAFSGTRGYVAAFQFRPKREATTSLEFGGVDSVNGQMRVSDAVRTEDLSGRFLVAASVPAAPEQASLMTVCPCLTKKKFPICLMLVLSFFLAAIAIVALAFSRGKNEEEDESIVHPEIDPV